MNEQSGILKIVPYYTMPYKIDGISRCKDSIRMAPEMRSTKDSAGARGMSSRWLRMAIETRWQRMAIETQTNAGSVGGCMRRGTVKILLFKLRMFLRNIYVTPGLKNEIECISCVHKD